MKKYSVKFSGEKRPFIVEANNEKEAFIKARDESESKGINLPDEVWTHIKEINTNHPTDN